MGHIITTPAGTYRANWRDPEVESAMTRGMYVDCGWPPATTR